MMMDIQHTHSQPARSLFDLGAIRPSHCEFLRAEARLPSDERAKEATDRFSARVFHSYAIVKVYIVIVVDQANVSIYSCMASYT